MRIYLAARYQNGPKLVPIREKLQDASHLITSRWIDRSVILPSAEQLGHQATKEQADIRRSDALILWPTPDEGGSGRFVEFGYAMALRLNCMVVEPGTSIFNFAPRVQQFVDWKACLAALGVKEPCSVKL